MQSRESLLRELEAIQGFERLLGFEASVSPEQLMEHRARLDRKEQIEAELLKRDS